MTRVLFLMTTKTYRAGAFLEAAGKLGIDAAVASEQTHILAHAAPGMHLTIDFNDIEGATDSIVEFVQAYPVDAIISTDDDGIVLAAMASDALKLKYNALPPVAIARNKYLTRKTLQSAGLPTPNFARFNVNDDPAEIAGRIDYPSVIKPLSLAGSRGVMRVNNPDEFISAWTRLVGLLAETHLPPEDVSARTILVERFIPGVEVAVEGLLEDGDLSILAIFDKPDPLDGPFFEETIYVTPSRHPEAMQSAIIATTRAAVGVLGLWEGPVHAEMRINEAGVWILEIAPRSIGGYCSRALHFGDDTSLEDLIIQQAAGLTLGSMALSTGGSGVMMIPTPAAGILCDTQGYEDALSVEGVTDIFLMKRVGARTVTLPEGAEYLGFIFARAESAAEAEAALREAHRRLEFIIEADDV